MSVAKKRPRPTQAGQKGQGLAVVAARTVPVEVPLADGLHLARAVAVRDGTVELDRLGERFAATIDPAVHPRVLEGAAARGERVLVEVVAGAAVCVGALRTVPTAGIDRLDELDVRADRIKLGAEQVEIEGEEVVLSSRTAKLMLRAAGEIESFADRIVSRASGVHKIVGRMLRLN